MIAIHMTTHRRLASGLLQRAVESVLSQDFTDFEFVILAQKEPEIRRMLPLTELIDSVDGDNRPVALAGDS